jgi:hypothetical protein
MMARLSFVRPVVVGATAPTLHAAADSIDDASATCWHAMDGAGGKGQAAPARVRRNVGPLDANSAK